MFRTRVQRHILGLLLNRWIDCILSPLEILLLIQLLLLRLIALFLWQLWKQHIQTTIKCNLSNLRSYSESYDHDQKHPRKHLTSYLNTLETVKKKAGLVLNLYSAKLHYMWRKGKRKTGLLGCFFNFAGRCEGVRKSCRAFFFFILSLKQSDIPAVIGPKNTSHLSDSTTTNNHLQHLHSLGTIAQRQYSNQLEIVHSSDHTSNLNLAANLQTQTTHSAFTKHVTFSQVKSI